jgi:hypothetical protein
MYSQRLPEESTRIGIQALRLLYPVPVVSGGSVGGRDAAVEPTRMYLRRLPEETAGIGIQALRVQLAMSVPLP